VFFLQSPSFLAHQRQLAEGHGRSNCQTLFGIEQIPTDSHIRALLDPVPPEHFWSTSSACSGTLSRIWSPRVGLPPSSGWASTC
jgi:hypothetical protein